MAEGPTQSGVEVPSWSGDDGRRSSQHSNNASRESRAVAELRETSARPEWAGPALAVVDEVVVAPSDGADGKEGPAGRGAVLAAASSSTDAGVVTVSTEADTGVVTASTEADAIATTEADAVVTSPGSTVVITARAAGPGITGTAGCTVGASTAVTSVAGSWRVRSAIGLMFGSCTNTAGTAATALVTGADTSPADSTISVVAPSTSVTSVVSGPADSGIAEVGARAASTR